MILKRSSWWMVVYITETIHWALLGGRTFKIKWQSFLYRDIALSQRFFLFSKWLPRFFLGLGAVVCLADCRFTDRAESFLYSLSLSMILMIALIILANLHPFQMIREFHCLGWRKHDGNWALLGSISRLLSVRHLHLWKARKGRHATRFLRSFFLGC